MCEVIPRGTREFTRERKPFSLPLFEPTLLRRYLGFMGSSLTPAGWSHKSETNGQNPFLPKNRHFGAARDSLNTEHLLAQKRAFVSPRKGRLARLGLRS